MLVLGAGPGGYSAAFRAADLGMKTVIVERYATLGGVCLNVGCIPSKALLHVAAVMEEAAARRRSRRHLRRAAGRHRQAARAQGQGRRQADRRPRRHGQGAQGRDRARLRQLPRRRTTSRSKSPRHRPGQDRRQEGHQFQKCIIAAGSAAVHLPFIPRDPRIVDSTGALELRFVPKKMLVIGGGIIGLEMATVYSTLGARVDVVEMLDGLMQGPDRDAVKVWEKQNASRFDKIMLKTKTVAVDAKDDGLYVKFEGEGASRRAVSVRHDPAGRRPLAERQEDRRRKGRRRRSPTAASSPSMPRCAPTCRTSSPSATSSASRCWRTRRCMKRTSRPKSPPASKAAFDAHGDPRRRLHPSGSGVGRLHRGAGEEGRPQGRDRPSSRGRPPVAPSPTAPSTASPS